MSLLWDVVRSIISFVILCIFIGLWQAYKNWSPRWDIRRPENDPEIKYREMKKKRKEGKK